ncbi:MAG: hypothetical protein MZV70_22505 [Desulfobacterales bacterium]|nr:hypothetical protein [Desulfobacterales bacterium]
MTCPAAVPETAPGRPLDKNTHPVHVRSRDDSRTSTEPTARVMEVQVPVTLGSLG